MKESAKIAKSAKSKMKEIDRLSLMQNELKSDDPKKKTQAEKTLKAWSKSFFRLR